MREIKFRTWNKNTTDGMVYQDELLICGNYSGVRKDQTLANAFDTITGFYDCILMQYTGLKDKNGKEIYEGDVVKGTWGISQIIFYHGAWCYLGGGATSRIYTSVKTAKVIGNIYENPELLANK